MAHHRAIGTLQGVATLLIVDDHAAVRARLEVLVMPDPRLEVTGSVADAETALAFVQQQTPDIALIDHHLPGENGLALCLRLESAVPPSPRVLYSAFADDLLAVLAAVAGADALVPKSADPEQLLDVLLAMAAGQRRVTRPSPRALRTVSAGLEPFDLPLVSMLVHGTDPREVADTLTMPVNGLLARRWAILRRLSPPPTTPLAADAQMLIDQQHRSPTR